MTTTYGGVTVKLMIERIAAEGKIVQEYIGTLNGGAANQTLYTRNFPITTDAGVATDDETLVDVFTNDGTLGSWTEYLDDGSDFQIVGATGAVTIQAAENQAGNVGERISISYYTKAEVGAAQNVEVRSEAELTTVHRLSSVAPQEIKEGPVEVSGTIGALYVSRDTFGKFMGQRDFYKTLADFSLYIHLDAPEGVIAGSSPYVKVANTKFGGGSLTVELGSILANNITFKGLAVSIGTNPA